jgi:hypothetical protein
MNDFNERDLFAALAMCGMVANRGLDTKADQFAKMAYVIADQMIQEKEKRDEAS